MKINSFIVNEIMINNENKQYKAKKVKWSKLSESKSEKKVKWANQFTANSIKM